MKNEPYDEEKLEERVELVVLKEPTTHKELAFGRDLTNKLRARYETAVENDEESFIFEDFEFIRDYAKYMLEFLDDRLV